MSILIKEYVKSEVCSSHTFRNIFLGFLKNAFPLTPIQRPTFGKRHLITTAFSLPTGTFLNVSLGDTLETKALIFF